MNYETVLRDLNEAWNGVSNCLQDFKSRNRIIKVTFHQIFFDRGALVN